MIGDSDTQRLEGLWSGEFGDEYIDRNRRAGLGRELFWKSLLDELSVQTVLEVGCNIGANLEWLAPRLGIQNTYGVDINPKAVATVCARIPGVGVLCSPARDLPFRDRRFDLVFTVGVLIHQSPESLPIAMAEIVRCSRRYVLCGEYFAEELTEVPYRGHAGALWKRDYGGLYQELFPDLVLRKQGFLPRQNGGWDDVTYWLFERGR